MYPVAGLNQSQYGYFIVKTALMISSQKNVQKC